ncbi:OmpP1/FadL family transporter [Pontibacter silvestris]|uniref:OmpP1/FadL family transporter n=1 Tax=Pontibacter silvestris TaxID=2305183 RepID=A0ABW4WXT2_9BACT|nr:hypothetical protein [Pontibacter silvestris]MCC9136595.1 hypothetical protein [Pontibacter silvestris]
MNVNKIFLASLALMLGWGGTAFAQDEVDALRYSRLGVSGSARIQGIGGAQAALGADISSLSVNPAGLGMFRRSEFTFSPGLQFNNTDTNTNGNQVSDSRNVLSVPQMGLVFSNRKGDNEDGDWRGVNFGIGFTRLNNFNQQVSYQNTTGEITPTIVEYFADLADANGRTVSDLDQEFNGGFYSLEGLAYGTYLYDIVEDETTGEVYAAPLVREGSILQQESIRRRGSQNQIDFGFGTSYKDRLYIGASVGIVTTRYTQESVYREAESSENTAFTDLELRDEFTSRGTGVNLKVGVIARPVDALRIGASIQTPTAYTFTDDYQQSLYAGYDDGPRESASIMPGQFSYRLTTPFKATGGVAVFLSKYGFITADIEYLNYSSAHFSEEDDGYGTTGNYFTGVNNTISDTYRSVWNYRIGAEGRYEAFRFRAGYAISSDPYKNASFDGQINSFTLGTGIRLQNYYVDVAYVNSNGNSRYSPYTLYGDEPVVDIENKQSTVMFTVGYNF